MTHTGARWGIATCGLAALLGCHGHIGEADELRSFEGGSGAAATSDTTNPEATSTSTGKQEPTPEFENVPQNSWIELGVPWQGGHELEAAFDQAHNLFFKYGGCGDYTQTINTPPEGNPFSDGAYGNSLW